jgi:hypothetical protein
VGDVAIKGEKRNSYQVLVEKRQGMRSLGRLRRRWENDTKICFNKIGVWGCVEGIHLAQIRVNWRALVNTVTDVRIRQIVGNFLSS